MVSHTLQTPGLLGLAELLPSRQPFWLIPPPINPFLSNFADPQTTLSTLTSRLTESPYVIC